MFQVLPSSAGAGKTHALVKSYLGKCFVGNDLCAYRQILALTFTTKAATEMKERVVHYLDHIGKGTTGDARIDDVIEQLVLDTGMDRPALRERARAIHGHMLHAWGDVAISTIDAFTQRVVRPFARDLKLDQDLRMSTDQLHYREQAVQRLIDLAGKDTRITEVLSKACDQLLVEERSWDPSRPLLELSQELDKERSVEPLERLSAWTIEELEPLIKSMNRRIVVFEQELRGLGEEALQLYKTHGIAMEEVAYGKTGLWGYFHKLSRFSRMMDPAGANVRAAFESGKWHSGKASSGSTEALARISHRISELFHHAEELLAKGYREHLIRIAVVRDILPAFALHELARCMDELKQEDGVVFFSDLTRRVAEMVQDEPVPFIYERMGARFKHFMIDEFQDTSLLQWKALLPLIDNALATGGSALIVGDAKQAIYRWRNGEVRLFVDLPRLFGRSASALDIQRERVLMQHYVKGRPLAHNRRSAERIVAFNNVLFAELAKELPDGLRKVYDEHEQLASRKESGVVHVVEASSDDELRPREQVLAFTLASLKAAKEDGHAAGDIAILVRSKALGQAVAAHLVGHGHQVLSPDALELGGDPQVRFLIALLRYEVERSSTTAVQVLQLRDMVIDQGRSVTDQHQALADPVAEIEDDMRARGIPLLKTTLSGHLVDLARAYGLEPLDEASLSTLLDEVHKWTVEHSPDPAGFLEFWDRSGHGRNTVVAIQDAVQVMTVHKSKGLQFPVVIVPEAQMSGGPKHGDLLWVAPKEAVPELDIALVRSDRITRAAELDELRTEEDLRLLDALDLLYVAFTRAESRLYALVPRASDPITKALTKCIREYPELARTPAVSDTAPVRKAEPTPIRLRSMARKDGPAVDARFEAPTAWGPENMDDRRELGTAVHAALERTRVPADLKPALDRSVSLGELTADLAQEIAQRIEPILGSPRMAPWFAEHLEVRSECTLIDRDGHSLRPDRVVVDEGKLRILEYKTGAYSPEHEEQVRGYQRLLQELGHTKVEGTIWYPFEDRLISVQA